MLSEQGKLPDIDWSQLFYSKIAYVPDGVTADELKRLQRQAYLGFYLRPSVLWKLKGQGKIVAPRALDCPQTERLSLQPMIRAREGGV